MAPPAIPLAKEALREVRLTFSPNSVIAVTIGGRAVPEESVRGVVARESLTVMVTGNVPAPTSRPAHP